MSLEFVTDYVRHWNEHVLQWTLITIVILGAGYFYWANFIRKKRTGLSADSASVKDLEETLKKVLENTARPGVVKNTVTVEGDESNTAETATAAGSEAGPAPAAGATGESAPEPGSARADVEAIRQEIENLKTKVRKRDGELAELRKKAGEPKISADAGLKAKIKELESKLLEYEIIEDDIADLSFFKEENAKLKAQLERLNASVPAPVQNAAAKDEELVEEFKDAVNQAEPVAPIEAPTEEQLAAQVEEVLASAPAAPEPAAPEPVAPVPEPTVEPEAAASNADNDMAKAMADAMQADTAPAAAEAEPAPSPAVAEADDILAEFASDVGGGQTTEGGPIDTDKMMSELAGLEALGGQSGDSALEEEFDVDKMAAEATKLVSDS